MLSFGRLVLLLRLVRKARWPRADPDEAAKADPGQAAEDLKLREYGDGSIEEGLSVYRVNDAAEAHSVAEHIAFTLRSPQRIDYLLADESILLGSGVDLHHFPNEDIHPYLSDRHYETRNYDNLQRVALAEALIAGSATVVSIGLKELKEAVLIYLKNKTLEKSDLQEDWSRKVNLDPEEEVPEQRE